MWDFLNSPASRIAFIVVIAVVLAAGIYATRARARRQARLLAPGGAIPTAPAPLETPKEPIAVLDFDEPPSQVPIYKSRVVIGRHREDDVNVNDIRVSRHHALLVHSDEGGFEIHNQTASRSEPNDLLVNGVYQEHAPLTNGDRVTVGGVSFVFRTPRISHTRAV